jgi:hypothetical protein
MKPFKVDFFVVGVARAGTTSLYNFLSKHPQLFLPKVKECNFFSDVESLDDRAYLSPVPGKYHHMKIINSYDVYESLYREAANDNLKGDVSPSYIWDRNTAKKIYEHNNDAKIIISLRNPIERAYSHYLMHFNTGYEKKSTFEEAIQDRKKNIWGGGNMYLEMSLYYDQVKEYFNYFNEENIYIVIYEDWVSNIDDNINSLYEFLDVDPFSDFQFDEKYNQTKNIKRRGLLNFFRKKKIKPLLDKMISENLRHKIKEGFFESDVRKEKLMPDTVERMKDFFKSDVEDMETLINKPLINKWDLK